MLFDAILATAFTILAAVLLFTHEDEIEEWREEQMRHYR